MPQFEVDLPGGGKWIGNAANHPAAIRAACAKWSAVNDRLLPNPLTVTVTQNADGAMLLPEKTDAPDEG